MKKTLLLACLLLLLASMQTQAAPVPVHPGIVGYKNFKSIPTLNENGATRVMAIKKDGSLTYVYVRLTFENEYYSGYSLIGDWVCRYYEDNTLDHPAYVTDLTINYRVMGWHDGNSYQWDGFFGASGTSNTIISGVEKDYDDGQTYRWRDYILLPGEYY